MSTPFGLAIPDSLRRAKPRERLVRGVRHRVAWRASCAGCRLLRSHTPMRTAIAPSTPRAAAFEPALLRANRLFESRDLDDTRERISRVMQPHHLRPLGRPEGGRSHMDFLRLGGIGVGTIDFGEAMQVDVEHVEDYHLLMFCLRGSAQARAGDRALDVDVQRCMICAPGARFVADLSADCEQFVLPLDRAMALTAERGLPGWTKP